MILRESRPFLEGPIWEWALCGSKCNKYLALKRTSHFSMEKNERDNTKMGYKINGRENEVWMLWSE